MRHDTKMILAWTDCKCFNDRIKIGSKVEHTDSETQQKTNIITTSEAYVVNDIPTVASNNRTIRLSELSY